jgi:hypothetical protein
VLQSIAEPPQERALPEVFRTTAWRDNSLQTALASWAQLRHNTILYAKQSLVAAEGGDAEEEEPEMKPRRHYVEPNLEAWQRLLTLIQQTLKLPLLDRVIREKLGELEALTDFLFACAQKHVAGRPLTKSELEQLHYIGGEMDRLAVTVVGGENVSGWGEIAHPADRRMPCVADVHRAYNEVLQVAVGFAHEIFVLVPAGSKFALARGASFSYYEFTHPAEDRLTDEQWQQMLGAEDVELETPDTQPTPPAQDLPKAPPQPAWIRPLYTPEPIKLKPAPLGEVEEP